MTSRFYYCVSDVEYGPVTGTEIQKLAVKKLIVANTPVRRGEDGEWLSASNYGSLFDKDGNPIANSSVENGLHHAQKTKIGVATIDQEEGFLFDAESLLVRMIIGSVKFPFVRFPKLIYRWLCNIFPTIVRTARVILLFLMWVIIVLGPLAIVVPYYPIQDYLNTRIPQSLLATLRERPVVTQAIGYTWTALAFIGSVWGVWYVRRKRKRVRQATQTQ